jgi:predicted amidohydrolase
MDTKNKQVETVCKVAAVQFEPELGRVEENRRRMIQQAVYAAERNARLIVFPEMATSGYVWNDRKEISPYVETIPGPTTEAMAAVAREYNCYVVAGLPEVDSETGIYYNSAVLVGPEGVVGKYRKTHLFAADARWAREGKEDIPVFSTEIGRIALLICMDAMYFEPSRIAALQGADIVAFPTNWVGTKNNPPSNTWRLRARESALCWVAANRWGTERGAQFTGGSAVIDRRGQVQDWLLSGEGIVFGEFQPDRHRKCEVLKVRHPSAYHDILLHPYLWKEGETRSISAPEPFAVVVEQMVHRGSAAELLERIRFSLEETNRVPQVHRLLVLPELHIVSSPETDADEFVEALRSLATSYRTYIVVTLPHVMEAHVVPTAVLIGPEGTTEIYHQVHADQLGRKGLGDNSSFVTVELPFARVGILTGGDAELPESYRVLAKQGADIIAISATGKEEYETWMQRIWAFENDAVVAAAAPAGFGGSLLFLHRQVVMEGESEHDGRLFQLFQPEMMATVSGRPFMRRLKTHLYDQLVLNHIVT